MSTRATHSSNARSTTDQLASRINEVWPGVEAWLRHRGVSQVDAEEALAEARYRMLVAGVEFRAEGSGAVSNYLRRTALTALQRGRTRPTLDIVPDVLLDGACPDAPSETAEVLVRLARGAYILLRPSDRLLVRAKINGCRFLELGRRLEVSETTARKRSERAFKRLREYADQLQDVWLKLRFRMDRSRVWRIAELADLPLELVANYLLAADWENADEHQAWLDEASDTEIADWIPHNAGILDELSEELDGVD